MFLSHLFQVQCVSGEGVVAQSSQGLFALPEDDFHRLHYLLACSNVSLERDGESVRTEVSRRPGNLPLVLCIAVRGLASLAHCV